MLLTGLVGIIGVIAGLATWRSASKPMIARIGLGMAVVCGGLLTLGLAFFVAMFWGMGIF